MLSLFFNRLWVSLALVVLACACWVSSTHALTSTDNHHDAEPVRVFMCADSGEYSGAHELGILQNSMEEAEVLTLAHCQSAQLGYIRHADGHRVRSLTVTTGIGFVSAALCSGSVLRFRHQRHLDYQSIVYIGTSGFSPMVGGWDPTNTTAYAQFAEQERAAMLEGEEDAAAAATVNPPPLFKTLQEVQEAQAEESRLRTSAVDAGEAFPLRVPSQLNFEDARTGAQLEQDGCAPRLATAATPLAVGSVCVTSSAFWMECGSCTERTRRTQCSRPHCSGFVNSLNSEAKLYFAKNTFAQEIEAASRGRAWPEIPADVQAGLETFWAANEAMEPAGRVAPTAPSFVACAEATVNAINVGAERDYLCREYTAYTLNTMQRQTAGAHRDADPVRAPFTASDVVCVQAMEAMGFLRAVLVDASAAASIPIAILRTASNYDMYPLKKAYVAPAVWRAAVAAKAVTVSAEVAEALEAAASGKEDGEEEKVAAYTWQQNFEFMPAEAYEKFVVASFHYSVKTVTFVVSNYFFGGRTFE